MVPRVSEPPFEKTLPSTPVVNEQPKSSPGGTIDIRPNTPRRATAPETFLTPSPFSNMPVASLTIRPRTRSPYKRGHARSRSSAGSLSAPQMTRAHSSPVPDTTGLYNNRPSSPLGPPRRHRSPMRKPSEESFSSFGSSLDIDQTISENSELDLTPRATIEFDSTPASPSLLNNHTFPRTRRRPASPLNQITQSAFSPATPKTTLRASTSTPSLAGSQYNESYPPFYSFSSSSIPSTPTSLRSRSPSISSLETIPDSPDAELEAENIARLKAAADREDQSEEGVRRRMGMSGDGLGKGVGGRDKRKRWSVCGAERRGDLDLETIWED